jgi:O-methyltransferase
MTLGQKLVQRAKALFGVSGSRGDDRWKKEGWTHPRSPELRHTHLNPAATFSPWLSDPDFMGAYQRIRKFTLVDIYRCYELWELARQSKRVEGVILEVGVWRGGTGCLLALAAPAKTVYLADTFAGVVNAGPNDTRYAGGEHADTSEALVRRLLDSAGVTNARLLKGVFPGATAADVRGQIAMLHADVDVYRSAKETIEWALPRLAPGSAIVFDDYGFYGCEGITRYVRELREQLDGFTFFHNLNGHAVFVKLGRGSADAS